MTTEVDPTVDEKLSALAGIFLGRDDTLFPPQSMASRDNERPRDTARGPCLGERLICIALPHEDSPKLMEQHCSSAVGGKHGRLTERRVQEIYQRIFSIGAAPVRSASAKAQSGLEVGVFVYAWMKIFRKYEWMLSKKLKLNKQFGGGRSWSPAARRRGRQTPKKAPNNAGDLLGGAGSDDGSPRGGGVPHHAATNNFDEAEERGEGDDTHFSSSPGGAKTQEPAVRALFFVLRRALVWKLTVTGFQVDSIRTDKDRVFLLLSYSSNLPYLGSVIREEDVGVAAATGAGLHLEDEEQQAKLSSAGTAPSREGTSILQTPSRRDREVVSKFAQQKDHDDQNQRRECWSPEPAEVEDKNLSAQKFAEKVVSVKMRQAACSSPPAARSHPAASSPSPNHFSVTFKNSASPSPSRGGYCSPGDHNSRAGIVRPPTLGQRRAASHLLSVRLAPDRSRYFQDRQFGAETLLYNEAFKQGQIAPLNPLIVDLESFEPCHPRTYFSMAYFLSRPEYGTNPQAVVEKLEQLVQEWEMAAGPLCMLSHIAQSICAGRAAMDRLGGSRGGGKIGVVGGPRGGTTAGGRSGTRCSSPVEAGVQRAVDLLEVTVHNNSPGILGRADLSSLAVRGGDLAKIGGNLDDLAKQGASLGAGLVAQAAVPEDVKRQAAELAAKAGSVDLGELKASGLFAQAAALVPDDIKNQAGDLAAKATALVPDDLRAQAEGIAAQGVSLVPEDVRDQAKKMLDEGTKAAEKAVAEGRKQAEELASDNKDLVRAAQLARDQTNSTMKRIVNDGASPSKMKQGHDAEPTSPDLGVRSVSQHNIHDLRPNPIVTTTSSTLGGISSDHNAMDGGSWATSLPCDTKSALDHQTEYSYDYYLSELTRAKTSDDCSAAWQVFEKSSSGGAGAHNSQMNNTLRGYAQRFTAEALKGAKIPGLGQLFGNAELDLNDPESPVFQNVMAGGKKKKPDRPASAEEKKGLMAQTESCCGKITDIGHCLIMRPLEGMLAFILWTISTVVKGVRKTFELLQLIEPKKGPSRGKVKSAYASAYEHYLDLRRAAVAANPGSLIAQTNAEFDKELLHNLWSSLNLPVEGFPPFAHLGAFDVPRSFWAHYPVMASQPLSLDHFRLFPDVYGLHENAGEPKNGFHLRQTMEAMKEEVLAKRRAPVLALTELARSGGSPTEQGGGGPPCGGYGSVAALGLLRPRRSLSSLSSVESATTSPRSQNRLWTLQDRRDAARAVASSLHTEIQAELREDETLQQELLRAPPSRKSRILRKLKKLDADVSKSLDKLALKSRRRTIAARGVLAPPVPRRARMKRLSVASTNSAGSSLASTDEAPGPGLVQPSTTNKAKGGSFLDESSCSTTRQPPVLLDEVQLLQSSSSSSSSSHLYPRRLYPRDPLFESMFDGSQRVRLAYDVLLKNVNLQSMEDDEFILAHFAVDTPERNRLRPWSVGEWGRTLSRLGLWAKAPWRWSWAEVKEAFAALRQDMRFDLPLDDIKEFVRAGDEVLMCLSLEGQIYGRHFCCGV